MASPGPAGSWQRLALWANGKIDLGATAAAMPADDLHAALVIEDERSGELHHASTSGVWHIWDGRCHRPDDSDRARRVVLGWALRYEQALSAVRAQIRAAVALSAGADATDRQAARMEADAWAPFERAARYAAGLRKTAGADSLLRMLAGVCGVPDAAMEERNGGWLNTASGTVDLATGLVKPHDAADMITYCLDVPYDPSARCPQFLSLLHRAAGGDDDVARYLLNVLGYCLLGSNPEQLIFFITGPTQSGKSTLLDIVRQVLGPLGHASKPELITLVRHGRNARTENSIRGKRLLTITETSAWMVIEETQVKRLTGERHMAVDQHYAKTEHVIPVTWAIVMATNQMPTLVDFDAALRRRAVAIPGGPTVPADDRDPHLASRILAEEKPGVLAALVAACVRYGREGLPAPLAVQMATAGYAADQDTVASFVADTCMMASGAVFNGVPPHIRQAELWTEYMRWSQGAPKLGRNEFYRAVEAQPGIERNQISRRFEGICWNPDVAIRYVGNGWSQT